jgi:hypothetical protein
MVRGARWGVGQARALAATTDPRPKATGDYENSFRAERIPGGARLFNKSTHARWVERGRNPGKAPPLEPLIAWVIAKGIVRRSRQKPKARFDEARSIAFAVQRKVAKKGIEGRYILDKTMVKVRAKVRADLDALIVKIAARPPKQ